MSEAVGKTSRTRRDRAAEDAAAAAEREVERQRIMDARRARSADGL